MPTATPGYQVARLEDKAGQRASDTAQIVLENCKVPAANRLSEEGVGYRIALANLESGRINVAAQATGMARAALEAAVAYSHERRSMGKTLFEHQAVNFRLADMATQVEAARQQLAASRWDVAGEKRFQARIAAVEEELRQRFVQALGGGGT